MDETKEGMDSVRIRVFNIRFVSFFPSSIESLERKGALLSQTGGIKGYFPSERIDIVEFNGNIG